MGKQTIKIQCDVDADGDSLTGSASWNDGEVREFTGWLGLIGALQAMLATDPDEARSRTAGSASTPTDPSEGGNE